MAEAAHRLASLLLLREGGARSNKRQSNDGGEQAAAGLALERNGPATKER